MLSAPTIPESAQDASILASTLKMQDISVTKPSRAPATPRDKGAREEVLAARGITTKGNAISLPSPYMHFASVRMAETSYKELPGFENLHIWLATDQGFLRELSE